MQRQSVLRITRRHRTSSLAPITLSPCVEGKGRERIRGQLSKPASSSYRYRRGAPLFCRLESIMQAAYKPLQRSQTAMFSQFLQIGPAVLIVFFMSAISTAAAPPPNICSPNSAVNPRPCLFPEFYLSDSRVRSWWLDQIEPVNRHHSWRRRTEVGSTKTITH